MSIINICLHDAANNCARNGATAVLTLRSGVQLEGKLDKPQLNDISAHIKTASGGWVTALVEEIVAVEAKP